MKKLLCTLIVLLSATALSAQYRVVFTLDANPQSHNKDSIFIAGNFNNWNPHHPLYSLASAGNGKAEAVVELQAGSYEYKCTRGSWSLVETDKQGKDIDNHFFTVRGDTAIKLKIAAWKDDFAAVVRKHTASKQVRVLDTAFYMPQLDRHRRIWIYLPEGYAKSKKRYPVLYMHDGQNLFDEATSGFGEWGVDECLDSLIKAGKSASIVVGIDNGPQRMAEYNPYEFQDFGKGEAAHYLAFLVETLKPYIDSAFRTLAGSEHTIIAGSSMGGLVSYYAALTQPGVFGKAGVFSPAFWTAPEIRQLTDSLASGVSGKFFFLVGEQEGKSYVQDMKEVQELLGQKSAAMIYSVIDPNGRHNEKFWQKWFSEFYTWMMANGYNTVIKLND